MAPDALVKRRRVDACRWNFVIDKTDNWRHQEGEPRQIEEIHDHQGEVSVVRVETSEQEIEALRARAASAEANVSILRDVLLIAGDKITDLEFQAKDTEFILHRCERERIQDSARIHRLEEHLAKLNGYGSKRRLCKALELWNVLEKESFLLGLYIFEKNFARLRRFIESKKLGIYCRITMLSFISRMNTKDGRIVARVEEKSVFWDQGFLAAYDYRSLLLVWFLMYLKNAIIPLW
nr:hypothetical protein CTI12_AA429060 [Tanacetum cinerariifolium]